MRSSHSLVVAATVMLSAVSPGFAASGPFIDKPAGPQSLPGDRLPPFDMLDDKGQLKPMPKIEGPLRGASVAEPESTAPGPNLKEATAMAAAAVAACRAKGFVVGAAVIDSVGDARALLTGDGSDGSHVFVAMRKALTALAFGVTSGEAGQQVEAGKAPLSKVTPAMFVAGGGVPIFANGKLVGALGVSGAAGSGPYVGFEDEQCAKAGLASVAARKK